MSLNKAPRSSRLHIGLFGRTNVGKSSFLNLVTNQEVSITSDKPGTTTDVVEKQMELLPLGPVVFFDTGGLDDSSRLAFDRVEKAWRAFDGVDVGVLVVEPDTWGEFETELLEELESRDAPGLVVVNKIDELEPSDRFRERLAELSAPVIYVSSLNRENADSYIDAFKRELIEICPEDFLNPPTLVGDLVPAEGLAGLVVPVDLEAPKDRLILPQVQTIRNALDNDAAALVVKDEQYAALLDRLAEAPDLAVCDSQAVARVAEITPDSVPFTTFSVLFARRKGDLEQLAAGAAKLRRLEPGDRVLIGEACSHHPIEDDIGRDKIPRWLEDHVGGELEFDVYSGRDFPDDISGYDIIVHCGGCMINRRRMLYRIQRAREVGVPITNYGLCISLVHGLLDRVLAPFPDVTPT